VSNAPPVDPARRDFLAQAAVGGAVSIGMGAASYGALLGRTDYTLETVPIALSKLPRALDGFSIVQLSDLHVGLYVGEPEFRRALELVERARPDIVVLTGDLVDHDPRYAPVLGSFVRSLRERARRGVFAIPGNHDYYAGVTQVLTSLREAGAEVLLNRHVLLGDHAARFALGGFDDVVGPRFGAHGPRPNQTFGGVPDELARVVLSHNPSYFPSGHGAADLTLSGHTHGGQITLFINPAELVLRHGFVRGHYLHAGSQLYVNRGFGTAGPPARVGSPPEITKLVLTAG
jgi:predicted MPP superfamily phosphohydrolase